jgi:hypothetical protein
MEQQMVGSVGKYAGWWTLVAALGCSGESAVVGANKTQATGGETSMSAESSGTVTRYLDLIRDAPGACLPTQLPVEDDHTAACKIFTATTDPERCPCDSANRGPATDAARDVVRNTVREREFCDGQGTPACSDFCVCEDLEASGQALAECMGGGETASDGWCYVAPDDGIGSPSVVADCTTEVHAKIRFMNGAAMPAGELAVLACSGGAQRVTARAPLGSVCVPSAEADASFSGFHTDEVSVDFGSPACESGICVVQQFQGRVSCPLGRPVLGNDRSCLVPDTTSLVIVGVPPQLVARPPSLGSTCSCRCAGPGTGPFCDCPEGLECRALIDALGLPGDEQAGSYCVPPASPFSTVETCLDNLEVCRGDRPY